MLAAAFLFVVLDSVFVNGHGPYRFLVDTGAQSSSVTAELARSVGLRPAYRVEQATAAGSRLTPAAAGVTLQFQGAAVPGLEVLIHAAPLPEVDGILGQNYLANFNYLLDANRGVLALNAPEPPNGLEIPFTRHHNRMVIQARLDGQPQLFVFDSGASTAVVPGAPGATGNAYLHTAAGSARAFVSKRILSLGHLRKQIPVAELPASPAAGLLPAAVVGPVYVNNELGYLRLP